MELRKLEIVTQEVLRDFPNITYSISASKKSSSLYLYLSMQDTILSMRISDHNNNVHYHFKHLVSKNININNLKRAIHNLCISLQKKRTYFLLNRITRQRECTAMA
ncbi:MAG: hypothetical protein E7354_04490 [Clostridiales bacterium]|nr:hypothetical protein [Clostridiales bacterium]